jgi:hypothetical protein
MVGSGFCPPGAVCQPEEERTQVAGILFGLLSTPVGERLHAVDGEHASVGDLLGKGGIAPEPRMEGGQLDISIAASGGLGESFGEGEGEGSFVDALLFAGEREGLACF